MDTKEFLNTLYPDTNDEYILIWRLAGKSSRWFKSADEAAAFVEGQKNKNDLYLGVGLSPENNGPYDRCPAAKIAGLGALWLDIDIQGPAHKKGNLPPDIAAAESLIADMRFEPSIVVHSGHGLQAWWVFREPWFFDTAEERSRAAKLSERWNGAIRRFAAKRGWDADATWDLARVMRLPGTVNAKTDEPVPVEVRRSCAGRYDPSELEELLCELEGWVQNERIPPRGLPAAAAFSLRLDPAASPPFEKFEALRASSKKFAQSWERGRKDLQDQSPSAYDLSLATLACEANWTPQEITNLLIACRRKHGDDLKLRQDYYRRTVGKARDSIARSRAQEAIEELADVPIRTQEDPESAREIKLDSLSEIFGVRVERIVRYLSDPPQYRLITGDGQIFLGKVDALIAQWALRSAIAAASGKYIPNFKPQRWDKIAQLLLDVCEDEEIGAEATDSGQVEMWIEDYLAVNTVLKDPEAIEGRGPFRKERATFLFGAHFKRWLQLAQNEKVNQKQLGIFLRAFGAEQTVVRVKNKTHKVWRLPN